MKTISFFLLLEYIFILCDALSLPIEAKYLAVEIYGRLFFKTINVSTYA